MNAPNLAYYIREAIKNGTIQVVVHHPEEEAECAIVSINRVTLDNEYTQVKLHIKSPV